MPNVLAHIGVQGLMSRGVMRRADAKWILMGCVIPDIPWILQRAVRAVEIGLDPYDVRLYAIAQASLAVCLLLCGACALLAASSGRVFLLLGLNSLLHLLLDAWQFKWANGVHLIAPISWELVNYGSFWPESLPSYILTGIGVLIAVWLWRSAPAEPGGRIPVPRTKVLGALILVVAYLGLPLALMHGPEDADNHFVRTLRERDARAGRSVEFDRNILLLRDGEPVLRTYFDEEIPLTGGAPTTPGIVSLRGRFESSGLVHVREYHMHSDWLRDSGNYIGLGVVLVFWARAAWRSRSGLRRTDRQGRAGLS